MVTGLSEETCGINCLCHWHGWERFSHLENQKYQKVCVGHAAELLKEVAGDESNHIVLGSGDVVVLGEVEKHKTIIQSRPVRLALLYSANDSAPSRSRKHGAPPLSLQV